MFVYTIQPVVNQTDTHCHRKAGDTRRLTAVNVGRHWRLSLSAVNVGRMSPAEMIVGWRVNKTTANYAHAKFAHSEQCKFRYKLHVHCVSKKVPTFKLSVTLSNLNRFSNLLQCWKAYEIRTKPIWHYPSHFRHVATLPWEIKHSNFLQMWKKTQTNCIFNRL